MGDVVAVVVVACTLPSDMTSFSSGSLEFCPERLSDNVMVIAAAG